jgi:1-acyl-sn-glycerol-3-phosphate acyltransferase
MRKHHPLKDLKEVARGWGSRPLEPKGAPRDDGRDDEALIPDPAWARTDAAQRARTALQHSVLFPVVRAFGHPEVIGADDLSTYPQPAVIAPNHQSHVDTALIWYALPRTWRDNTVVAAATDHFYANKAVGTSVSLLFNTIPFERRGRLRGLRSAEKLLDRGWNVVMYAQGTRRAEGSLDEFHPGIGRVCIRARVPAIPVWISGSGRMMPPHRGWPRPTKLTIAFGRPIWPDPADDHTSLAGRIEAAVKALAESGGHSEMIGRPPIEHFRS